MNRIAIDDIEMPPTISPAAVLRPLGRALETTDVAINYFELAPGDAFGFDYHRHLDQEELFVVLEGVATFRTESGDVEVAAGEAIRFPPGELQLGRNEVSEPRSDGSEDERRESSGGPERVVALAIGAPGETRAIEYRRPCPDCGEETIQTPEVDREALVITIECRQCGSLVEEFRLGA